MQLDYATGVMPITRVDCALDKLVLSLRSQDKVERDAYEFYDADDMRGLPIGLHRRKGNW
jgi:hypothetical protein